MPCRGQQKTSFQSKATCSSLPCYVPGRSKGPPFRRQKDQILCKSKYKKCSSKRAKAKCLRPGAQSPSVYAANKDRRGTARGVGAFFGDSESPFNRPSPLLHLLERIVRRTQHKTYVLVAPIVPHHADLLLRHRSPVTGARP